MASLGDRVILRASLRVEAVFGWTPRELEGQSIRVLYPGQTDYELIGERARKAMYEARKRRIAPVVDTKTLADWNGLMVGALASAGRRLGRGDLVARAAKSADFIRDNMMQGRTLKHFFAEGEARVDGFLDDYAFFGRGCLELFLALGRKDDLGSALLCGEVILSDFEDKERGGFFRTREGDQDLLIRARQTYEGAVPSGASVAIELLLRRLKAIISSFVKRTLLWISKIQCMPESGTRTHYSPPAGPTSTSLTS